MKSKLAVQILNETPLEVKEEVQMSTKQLLENYYATTTPEQVVKELEDLGVEFENEVTHDELIKFGFKLNFPYHPQAFYSFELDDETQFYYSNNKLSLFKKHIGNVHQFQNINSFNDMLDIINVFSKYSLNNGTRT